jgi:hypothetical protein
MLTQFSISENIFFSAVPTTLLGFAAGRDRP